MKITTKIFMGMLLIAMVVTGVSLIGPSQAKAAQKSDSAKRAYETLMGSNKKVKVPFIDGYDYNNAQMGKFKTKTKSINMKPFIHYIYKDLDKDGTPELLVSNKKDGYGRVMICTFMNGNVKPILCIDGIRSGIYTASGNKLGIGFGASTAETYAFIKVAKGKMTHIATYCHESCHIAHGKMEHHYYKNGKKITSAKYKKAHKMIGAKLTI